MSEMLTKAAPKWRIGCKCCKCHAARAVYAKLRAAKRKGLKAEPPKETR